MVTTRHNRQRQSPVSSRGNSIRHEPQAQRRPRTRCPSSPAHIPTQETVTSPDTTTTAIPILQEVEIPAQLNAEIPTTTTDNPFLVGVTAVIDDLRRENQALQRRMDQVQQERDPNRIPIEKPQPLVDSVMTDSVPPNFKPPPLESYDSKRDPQEHLTSFDTQMAIIGAHDTLICKLFSGTMKGAVLRWYMSLPRKSIVSYTDFTKSSSGTSPIESIERPLLPPCSTLDKVQTSPSAST